MAGAVQHARSRASGDGRLYLQSATRPRGLHSPNQVLTHSARAAGGWWLAAGGRARRARRALVRATANGSQVNAMQDLDKC